MTRGRNPHNELRGSSARWNWAAIGFKKRYEIFTCENCWATYQDGRADRQDPSASTVRLERVLIEHHLHCPGANARSVRPITLIS